MCVFRRSYLSSYLHWLPCAWFHADVLTLLSSYLHWLPCAWFYSDVLTWRSSYLHWLSCWWLHAGVLTVPSSYCKHQLLTSRADGVTVTSRRPRWPNVNWAPTWPWPRPTWTSRSETVSVTLYATKIAYDNSGVAVCFEMHSHRGSTLPLVGSGGLVTE